MDNFCPGDELAALSRPGLIESFADELIAETRLDPVMTERLRLEILDHLAESLAEEPADATDRETAVLGRFGSIEDLRPEFAGLAVERRSRRTKDKALLAIILVFSLMLLRTLLMGQGWRDPLTATGWGSGLLLLDRYGFLCAAAILVGERFLNWWRRIVPKQQSNQSARAFAVAAVPALLIILSASAGIAAAFVSVRRVILPGISVNVLLASLLALLVIAMLQQLVILIEVFWGRPLGRRQPTR